MIQQSVQFGGLTHEDSNLHIANFLEICDTFKHNEVSDEAMRLRLFPFSLRDKAKSWLTSLPLGSITTWEQMTQKFLSRYFPPAKTAQLHYDITMFVQTFYNGLNSEVQNMINAAVGGTLGKKTPEQAYELLEEMASNSYQWPIERLPVRRTSGVHNIDAITALAAQMQALNKKIDGLQMQKPTIVASMCDFCGEDHLTMSVNQGHPNFSWSNNNQVKPPPPGFQSQEKKSNLEEMMAKFLSTTETRIQNQEASINNLEA
ncbi:uncharacterized protein LOC116130674 [Pistacia vera]|uniref:uncharacterized protein LOC116130674 n=1 Tax=Pistacia vera TaxID=55513 RepID=UPI0012630803|nr:uncharacterized protein LOC116130674 [Pistacia vera]